MVKKKNQNKKMPSAPKKPLTITKNKPLLMFGLAGLILVLFLVIFASYRQAQAGKAIYLSEAHYPFGRIDLSTEEFVVLRTLPAVSREINISAGLNPYDDILYNYTVNLTKRDSDTYNVYVKNSTETIAQDILDLSTVESINLHLNDDAQPDLQISYSNGPVTIKSLQYVSADKSIITFTNRSGTAYPLVILINSSQPFEGLINASSSAFAPLLSVNLGSLVQNYTILAVENRTASNYTYAHPASSGPEALLLDIKAAVRTMDTFAHYVLAVDGLAYTLDESNYPKMSLTMIDKNQAELNITFRATTELQPFALPCLLTDNSLNNFFAGKPIKTVYAYAPASGSAKIWAPGAPSELTTFSPWEGYFVRLNNADSEVKISTTCFVEELLTESDVPELDDLGIIPSESKLLASGWNLISIPGVVSRPLSDLFTSSAPTNYTVYQCSQNYACSEYSGKLNPGKPYWIYTAAPLTLNFAQVLR
ncbi:MAG TPA: hypothetical protein VJG49_01070 [Candidatus Nanoarchaeia archaeon]|nr:hypothetical protein [Candidatus Nanoarchaeia archaeon]